MQRSHSAAHRRRYAAVAVAMTLGSSLLLTGCGAGSNTPATPATPAPSSTASVSPRVRVILEALANCLRKNGVTLPATPTGENLRAAYQALSKDQRAKIASTCRGALPSGLAASLRARASATP